MLAEISDKIPSVTDFWFLHLGVAALAVLLCLIAQRRAMLFGMLPLTPAWATLFVLVATDRNDPLAQAVLDEMGLDYVLHQIAAALTPATAVVACLLFKRRPAVVERRGFEVKLGKPQGG